MVKDTHQAKNYDEVLLLGTWGQETEIHSACLTNRCSVWQNRTTASHKVSKLTARCPCLTYTDIVACQRLFIEKVWLKQKTKS